MKFFNLYTLLIGKCQRRRMGIIGTRRVDDVNGNKKSVNHE